MTMTKDTVWLYDYETGERVRPATPEHIEASREAALGVIAIDDHGDLVWPGQSTGRGARSVYVEEGDL